MRLDKFLKVSRLIKRRTLAKEVCMQGRILINGRQAKAGTEVKPGDRLRLNLGRRQMDIEVVAIPETIKAGAAGGLYRILADFKEEDFAE
ncbi:MAG: RNA-binding S4 domain-containing protein [bacterium]